MTEGGNGRGDVAVEGTLSHKCLVPYPFVMDDEMEGG